MFIRLVARANARARMCVLCACNPRCVNNGGSIPARIGEFHGAAREREREREREHEGTDNSLTAGRRRKQRGAARARSCLACVAYACACMQTRRMGRRDDGRQCTRGTGIRTRGISMTIGGRESEASRGGRVEERGAGTSDSNYVELRADKRPIRWPARGACRGIARAVTLLPIAYRPRSGVMVQPSDTVRYDTAAIRLRR